MTRTTANTCAFAAWSSKETTMLPRSWRVSVSVDDSGSVIRNLRHVNVAYASPGKWTQASV